jgi:hypothetical protein
VYLAGPALDPESMALALGLPPIRSEDATTNQVTVHTRGRPPTTFRVTRKIDVNRLKVTVSKDVATIEHLFGQLISAVDALPKEMRAAWEQLSVRIADLGLYWTNESNCGTEYDVPTRVVASLGQLGITLRISVYGTEAAIDRAIQSRNTTSGPDDRTSDSE